MVEQQAEVAVDAQNKDVVEQVERILRSEEFRNSEVLRRLLKFLADKLGSGDGDDIREYSVAIGGEGAPSASDPHHNSTIRIQVGRLRRKLADYYRSEGQNDPIIVDVPKGAYKLHYAYREETSSSPISDIPAFSASFGGTLDRPASPSRPSTKPSLFAVLACAVLLLIMAGAAWLWQSRSRTAATLAGFSPELQELWQPFLDSKRPLIMAIQDPLFAEIRSGDGIYIRDRGMNEWKDALDSPSIVAAQKAAKGSDMQPNHTFITFEQARTSLLITKLLGQHVENLSIARASEVTLQQMADNNVLFIGIPREFFASEIQPMPIHPQLVPEKAGIRNLSPRAGEPQLFANDFSWFPNDQGTVYALISHLPGPLGDNDTESFVCRRPAGVVAAVKDFTDPVAAKGIVDALKKASGGRMPRYFQVVLKVQFKADVPITTELVLVRSLSS